VRLPDRLAAINTVADASPALDRHSVDDLVLRWAFKTAPFDWDRMANDRRREVMVELLGQMHDDVLEKVYPPLDPQGAEKVDAIVAYLLDRSESDVRFVLEQSGEPRFAPSRWKAHTVEIRRSYLAMLLRTAPDGVTDGLYELVPSPDPPPAPEGEAAPLVVHEAVDEGGPIFVVHGHAKGLLYELQVVLANGTGREIVVLHQRANEGKTLIEKFEDEAEKAAFAVVLLTADDEGGAKADGAHRPRGRQNVIFELGFFYAKLGRNRVAVLIDEGVEEPSDLRGLVYIPIDPGGGWKQALARELKTASIPFDFANVP
jgi:hypothetical protein